MKDYKKILLSRIDLKILYLIIIILFSILTFRTVHYIRQVPLINKAIIYQSYNPSSKNLGTLNMGDRVTVLRSEEHTSELQSRFDLVCLLLISTSSCSSPFPYTTLFRSLLSRIDLKILYLIIIILFSILTFRTVHYIRQVPLINKAIIYQSYNPSSKNLGTLNMGDRVTVL